MIKVANIVKTESNPVVDLYMDIVGLGFEKAGYTVNSLSKGTKFSKKELLVTDTIITAFPYILKGYKRLAVWFQGVGPEESYMRNKSKLRYKVLSFMEKLALKRAQIIILVSNEMLRFYEKKYNLDLSQKAFIMPCFNEQGVAPNAFNEEKYANNNFVYLGGLQPWQCFEQTAKIYAEVEKKSQKPTKFFVFTGQKEKATEILDKYGAQNYEVDFVSPDELSKRIQNIKYGFVLREDNAVNNVATPTKFSNYLSNGIIPIYSGAVKSFNEYDEQLNLGVECNLNDTQKGVENILEHIDKNITSAEVKEKCEKAFSDYYNQQKYIKELSSKIKEVF